MACVAPATGRVRENSGSMSDSKRVLFLCAQGGQQDAELVASVGRALQNAAGGKIAVSVASLRNRDANSIREQAPTLDVRRSFEEFRREKSYQDIDSQVMRLARDYGDVNWWAVAASERSFIDASFLVGGLGQRSESREYVEALIASMVCYFEAILSSEKFSAVLCPEADSLISHVLYQVARRLRVRIVALSPNAWIREDGRPGFFLCCDEFLHSDRMEAFYKELGQSGLSKDEQTRVRRFKRVVVDFDVQRDYRIATNNSFVVPAISPNLKALPQYLWENASRDKDVEYYKIDVFAKAKANILRAWRRWRSKNLLGTGTINVPRRSVFYAMQYQPEQSSLVGGIFFANQIATIENIAKALPFGYTLVVKEHPRGRGARPAWQYRHLAHFPNVQFCDAGAKDILKQCEATVTISGTIGLEALALDKPVVVLGNVYYDFADIVYKPKSWSEVAQVLRRILIDREYEQNASRQDLIDRFFLSYLVARVPALLSKDSAAEIAGAIIAELDVAGRALRPEDKKTNDRVENG